MDSAAFRISSSTTEIARKWTLPGMRFARECRLVPVVPVVLTAWRRAALPKEKGGAVTTRRLRHPFHKGLASLMALAQGLQDLPMEDVPVVRKKLTHLLASSRPSVRTPSMTNMEFKVSVETGAGVEATASQMILNLMEKLFVQGFRRLMKLLQELLQSLLVAPAAKSVLTQLALQKENNGVASVRRKRPCCLKALVSLMIPVLELQTALMKTPLVSAAIQNTFLHAIKQRNVGKPSLKVV